MRTYLGAEVELTTSETCPSARTGAFTKGQSRPLLRFHVATSLSCPTISVGLSCAGAAPGREEAAGAGCGALTRPNEGREGKDMLVPPIPGTALGTERFCSYERRLISHLRSESEPSAGSNMRISWKSDRLRRCGGERGSCDGDECAELGAEPGGETALGDGSNRLGSE